MDNGIHSPQTVAANRSLLKPGHDPAQSPWPEEMETVRTARFRTRGSRCLFGLRLNWRWQVESLISLLRDARGYGHVDTLRDQCELRTIATLCAMASRKWELFFWKGFRYLQLTFRNCSSPWSWNPVRLIFTSYHR